MACNVMWSPETSARREFQITRIATRWSSDLNQTNGPPRPPDVRGAIEYSNAGGQRSAR